MLSAGRMRDRVTLRKWTPTNDASWGPQPGWTDSATFWASVETVAATEKFAQQGVQTQVSHRVRLRHRADVTSKDRLVYRGRVLDILGIHDPDGRKRELLIEAKENVEEA